jgi:hypothetical protein
MPIVSTDIKEFLSGGAANTSPAAALGGARSTAGGGEITDNTTHNLWDVVSSAESSAGDTEYRCVYVVNAHGSLTLQSAKVWISTNTPSADTAIRIALGTSAVNGTEQTIANETTAPSGVTWSTAANEGAALSIGNLPAGQHKAIWIERVITAGAAAANDDSYVLTYAGDTAA